MAPQSINALYTQLISQRNKAVQRIMGRQMVSVHEAAKNKGLTIQYMYLLLKQDRIDGAYKSGKIWFLPYDWKYKKQKRGWKKGKKRKKLVVKRSDMI